MVEGIVLLGGQPLSLPLSTPQCEECKEEVCEGLSVADVLAERAAEPQHGRLPQRCQGGACTAATVDPVFDGYPAGLPVFWYD